jgi:3'-phosphoadenosine 5'-phosphosulfate sulfotransferase
MPGREDLHFRMRRKEGHSAIASTKAQSRAGNMRDITKAAQSARAAIAVTVALIWKIVRRFAGCSTSTPRQTPGPSV